MQRLTLAEVARMAGVTMNEVFDAESFLADAEPVTVQFPTMVLEVELTKLNGIK